MKNTINIATRKSDMARIQANAVKQQLSALYPEYQFNIIGFSTQGDENTKQSLASIGGKNLFIKELQAALLLKQADIAVHCIKDMSVQPTPGLKVISTLSRDDPRDALVNNHGWTLSNLPPGATVGTSSPRRTSLVLAKRPDIHIKLLRGNVNTRLKKLDNNEYDAIILAAAGLKRLNLSDRITEHLPIDSFIPCIGQGALGLECRDNDTSIQELLMPLNDHVSQQQLLAEQTVNRILKGNCHSPIGAHATFHPNTNTLTLSAFVSSLNGANLIETRLTRPLEQAAQLGEEIANALIKQGAIAILSNPEESSDV